METNILLYGAGGHAKVIMSCLETMGVKVAALFDDNPLVTDFMGLTVHHNYSKDIFADMSIVISIGDNKSRSNISNIVEHRYCNVIHPESSVAKLAFIDTGTVVFQNSVIQTCAKVGKHCIINTGSILEHDSIISDFVHVSPNATLSGTVTIGEGTQIGAGAVIIPNINIGKWSVIGAGAVVIKDLPDFCVAVGNPARIIKYMDK